MIGVICSVTTCAGDSLPGAQWAAAYCGQTGMFSSVSIARSTPLQYFVRLTVRRRRVQIKCRRLATLQVVTMALLTFLAIAQIFGLLQWAEFQAPVHSSCCSCGIAVGIIIFPLSHSTFALPPSCAHHPLAAWGGTTMDLTQQKSWPSFRVRMQEDETRVRAQSPALLQDCRTPG